jgi:hypothetical protein
LYEKTKELSTYQRREEKAVRKKIQAGSGAVVIKWPVHHFQYSPAFEVLTQYAQLRSEEY